MKNDTKLRLLTYNMHKGLSFLSRRQVLEEIKRAIQDVDADLVFLQEIRGDEKPIEGNGREATVFESQLEYLADTVWPHFAYGKNAIYQSSNHGNAILSRFPVKQWSNVDVSTNPFERRGLLHVVVAHPLLRELHLICLHLNLLATGRHWQIERLVGKLKVEVDDGPLIIAGDFNDWPQGLSGRLQDHLQVIEAHHSLHGRHARTFPSLLPLLCLDRVYCRQLAPLSAQVLTGKPWTQMSDHVPLLVELDLVEPVSR